MSEPIYDCSDMEPEWEARLKKEALEILQHITTPEALAVITAVVEGHYAAAEVVTFEGHTYQLLRVDFDTPCPQCGGTENSNEVQ